MHRRLVFEEPFSRAAVWSRRLARFSLVVLGLSLLLVRLREPSIEGLAPVAGAYLFVLVALGLALLAFVRIWQKGHRGVSMAAGALLLCLVLLAPAGYVGFLLATRPALADVSTDVDDPPAFSRSMAALSIDFCPSPLRRSFSSSRPMLPSPSRAGRRGLSAGRSSKSPIRAGVAARGASRPWRTDISCASRRTSPSG